MNAIANVTIEEAKFFIELYITSKTVEGHFHVQN